MKMKILKLGKRNFVRIVNAKTGEILTNPISIERVARIIETSKKIK